MKPSDGAAGARRGLSARLILTLILSISALIQFTVVSRTTVEIPLRVDAGDYFSYAYNLSHHGVYSISHTWKNGPSSQPPAADALRPPGYPLFLTAVGTPEPTEGFLRRVSLVQAALGVLSVWLVYLVARSFLGAGGSLAAAGLTALSPHLAVISTYLLSESLFFFLLLASLLTSLGAIRSQARWQYCAAGLLWGLSSLVRPTAELFPPLALLAVFLVPRLRKYRLPTALGFFCFLLVMAPWFIRNQQASVDKPAPSLMVKALAHGSYPNFMFQGIPESFEYPYRYDPDGDRITRDLPTILKHIAGRFREEPLVYSQWYLIGKPVFFLSWGNVQGWDILIYPVSHTPYFEDSRFSLIRVLTMALHWPLMVLGMVASAMLCFRADKLALGAAETAAARLIALVVVYAILFHMIIAPFPRYGIPFRPLLYVLAMLPLRALYLRWKQSKGIDRIAGSIHPSAQRPSA
jgi:4-amino-4-deoxy-L-arabinose transferase-like glycosyltransferase